MEALTTNGTDEGVLRAWLDREFRHWQRAFEATLQHEIDELRRNHLNGQPGRTDTSGGSNAQFSLELGELLFFSRSSGALSDTALQRLRDAAEPKAGRGADTLDRIFAEVREMPAGDRALHESWVRCLMLLFYQHAASGAATYPGPDALYSERLAWARRTLAGFTRDKALSAALEQYLTEPGVGPVVDALVNHSLDEVLRYHQEIPEDRTGLFTSAGARWLVGAVERS